jgi:hypothetical protein
VTPPARVRVLDESAGFYPIDARFRWVSIAGCAMHCSRCGADGRAPSPREVHAYNAAAEGFLAAHKHCQEAA